MKKISTRLIIASTALLLVFASALYAADKMVIIYKDGNSQAIDIDRIAHIEYQTGSASFSESRFYRFTAKHSNKCLDVWGVSRDNAANIYQWDCHGGDNQAWKLVDKGEGYYMIIAKHSNKCLDVSSVSNNSGANVQQWECHGGPNQLWKIASRGDGYFSVIAKNSNKCLDIASAGMDKGANAQQWDCHGGGNQAWKIEGF